MSGKAAYNQIVYWAFVILWAIYGLIYESEDDKRNIGYNILDLFSKCFVGIFLLTLQKLLH